MAKREFQKVDLTEGKPRLLDFIISNPGCSQREIASCCKIEPATATSIISSMEKEEYSIDWKSCSTVTFSMGSALSPFCFGFLTFFFFIGWI